MNYKMPVEQDTQNTYNTYKYVLDFLPRNVEA